MECEASNVPSNSNMTIPILPAELIGEILSRASGEIPLEIQRNGIIKNVLLNLYFMTLLLWLLNWIFPLKTAFMGSMLKGFCNGLVYLADNYLDYSLLWNPTTRKHKNSPFFRPKVRNPGPIFGFGYDELHDDYKSDSWTNVDYCDEGTFFVTKSSGYCGETLIDNDSFVDGKLHWSTSTSIPGPDPNVHKGKYIIAFDLANKNWEKVEKPSFGEGEVELRVRKLRSDLSVFSDYKTTHIGAWVMKEYGVKESWTKMFTIRYPNDPEWLPNFFMSNNGEILSLSGTTSIIYNSKDDSFQFSNVINCHYETFRLHPEIEGIIGSSKIWFCGNKSLHERGGFVVIHFSCLCYKREKSVTQKNKRLDVEKVVNDKPQEFGKRKSWLCSQSAYLLLV
ncbi:hypothetical protein H5410_052559 [Solanum commersonii]|uniref:F-box associated beta-propeller type 1 domain-containing protein n=1 Tax=Solanum commersonii TaxID=4109 RepID=A0A9J5X3Q8_SOLCO|nr:hypothetical protein H5410_052559 [Solanum commersonii]